MPTSRWICCRVLKMLLVHDIVEIDAGDTFAYDKVGALTKEARERAAADRIFGLLPLDQGSELQGLWEEFDAFQSADARFANAMDRLIPVLQNFRNEGGTWREAQVDRAAADRRLGPIGDGATPIGAYVNSILDAAVAAGMIRP